MFAGILAKCIYMYTYTHVIAVLFYLFMCKSSTQQVYKGCYKKYLFGHYIHITDRCSLSGSPKMVTSLTKIRHKHCIKLIIYVELILRDFMKV